MSAPAAPLEKAVAEAGVALAAVGGHGRARAALTALLAALDADPWWLLWQTTYHSQREAEDRLEKAEAELREIADGDCETVQYALREGNTDERTCAEKAPTMPDIWCGFCIARRYFAERGER